MSRKIKTFKTGMVEVSVDYEYDIHSIRFSGRTWKRIVSGVPVTIKGQGFHVEGEIEQDHWVFNSSQLKSDGMKGSVHVYTDEARDIYHGKIDDGKVRISAEL